MTDMRHTMTLTLTAILLLCSSCSTISGDSKDDPKSLVAQAREQMKMAEKYHKLANEAKEKQAALQGFIALWIEACKVKGQVLKMGQDGDPSCTAPDPAPITPTAQPTTPQPTPSNSSVPSTRPPITPAKKQ